MAQFQQECKFLFCLGMGLRIDVHQASRINRRVGLRGR